MQKHNLYWLFYKNSYFVSLFKNLYANAAIAEPINGATINTQTWAIALVSPTIAIIVAGAKLLAGLTDVPVKLIPIKWTNVRVNPITIPLTEDFFSSEVTPNIVYINTRNAKIH